MKIDSHQHFWRYDPATYAWITDDMAAIRQDFSPKDLEQELRRNQIDGCIAVQATQSEEETRTLLNLAYQHSFIRGVVGWVDLSSEMVEERLSVFSTNPLFKGVRHTVWDTEGEFMSEPAFQKGVSTLTRLGLTYDILVFDYQLPGALNLARQYPDQAFVLDHMGKPQISNGPTREWIAYIELLGKLPNVHCKLSGMFTETANFNWEFPDFYPFLEVVTNSFGPDRLLYGSDWPVCLAAGTYDDTIKVLTNYFSKCPEGTLDKIFGGNAAHFYDLE